MNYNVDIVLCMDATSSMSKIIAAAKARAMNFYEDIRTKMAAKQKTIDQLRVKCIIFRDLYDDPPDMGLHCTEFFMLPAQLAEYKAFIEGISAKGGGSIEENSLEALALAIKSDWTTGGDRRRHVIALWTDAPAHRLERYSEEQTKGQSLTHYPPNIPESFGSLTELWMGQTMDTGAKRLVLFAPDAYPWAEICEVWDNVLQQIGGAGKDLTAETYDKILEAIASSI